MLLWSQPHDSGPYVKGETMKFVKRLARNFLLVVFVTIVLTIGFIVPIGILLLGILAHILSFFLVGLIWLLASIAICITIDEKTEKQFKEDFLE